MANKNHHNFKREIETRFGKIYLPDKYQAREQAGRWLRYTEDFLRRYFDPIYESLPPNTLEALIFTLCYLGATALLIFMHLHLFR